MKVKEKLISNTFYLFLNWFSLTLLSLIYWIFAAKNLLPSEYGIVATSFNLASLLSGISILGLNVAISKLVPEYIARKKSRKISVLIKKSFLLVFALNILIFISIFAASIASPFLQTYFKLTLEIIVFSLILMLISSFSKIFSSTIYGFQEMKKYFASNFLGRLTKVILAIFLVYLGLNYFGILIALLGESAVVCLSFLYLLLKKINLKVRERIDFNHILKNFAFPAFIASLAQLLFSNSQYILLTLIKNLEVTGIFALAMLLTSIITTFPTILNSALFPITSFLSAFKDNKKQAYLINLVTRYSIFLTLPIAFLLSIFSKEVILIISKEAYLPASNLFPILSISAIILGIGNVFLSNLYAIGKTRINRNIVVLSSTSFLIFSIPLTFYFSSLGMSIAYFLSSSLLFSASFFFIKRFLKIKFPIKDFIKCLVSALISFLLLYFLVKYTTRIWDYVLALLACFLYLLILAILKFYSKDDIEILKFFARRIKFLESFVKFAEKFLD